MHVIAVMYEYLWPCIACVYMKIHVLMLVIIILYIYVSNEVIFDIVASFIFTKFTIYNYSLIHVQWCSFTAVPRNVAENKLVVIDDIIGLHHLLELDLHSNLLSDAMVSKLSPLHSSLRLLHLGENNVSNINVFAPFLHLVELNLSKNDISSLDGMYANTHTYIYIYIYTYIYICIYIYMYIYCLCV